MHTLLHLGLVIFSDPSTSPNKNPSVPSPPDSTIKVAIIGMIGLVLATTITAVASTFKKDPRSQPNDVTRRYINGLEKDRRDYGKLREEHTRLREACLQRQLDPDEMIREESP